MGAWMKSKSTQKCYLTDGYEVYEDVQNPAEVSQVLGFSAATSESKAILREIARVKTARAGLVKDIADKVLAGVAAGITVTADVDERSIALMVEAQLADEFAAINDNIDDQPTEFTIAPKA